MKNRGLAIQLITKRFGVPRMVDNELSVNCPYCAMKGLTPNTTYKLGINIDKDVYHCFRCGVGGKLVNLFPQLITAGLETEKVIQKVEEQERVLEPLPVFQTLNALEPKWEKLVFKFLHDKGVSPSEVDKKIFFVDNYKKKEYEMGPRLIFPIYQFGTYRGFQARTIYKNTDPKYTGATNMDRRSILYNFDVAFSQHKQLVITEGFFDQMKTGDTAIATLGKIITEQQIRLIKLGTFERVIVFLDADAKAEAYENAHLLKKHFPTFVAHPTAKDPGEMTRAEINTVFATKLERIF